MTGSLYYEVTASGRRVALCVDKHDAEEVARHWYDGQVREAHVLIMADPQPVDQTFTYTWQPAAPLPEAKRKEEHPDPDPAKPFPMWYPVCPRCGKHYDPTIAAGTCH